MYLFLRASLSKSQILWDSEGRGPSFVREAKSCRIGKDMQADIIVLGTPPFCRLELELAIQSISQLI